MRYFRESGGGWSRPPSSRPLPLVGLCLLALPLLPGAGAAQTTAPGVQGDTARGATAFHFRKSVSLDTEYLARVLAGKGGKPEVVIEVDPPGGANGSAAGYARRYRISHELARQILDSATAEGLDPELAFRLVRTESRFVPRARSRGGALGLTQLMPSTARSIDRSLRTEAQILEPRTNLRTGFRYLRQMIERYDGNLRLGLLAYNRGEIAVDRALGAGRDPENGYSHRVLGTRGSSPYRGAGLLEKP